MVLAAAVAVVVAMVVGVWVVGGSGGKGEFEGAVAGTISGDHSK